MKVAPAGGYPGLEMTTEEGMVIGVGKRFGELQLMISSAHRTISARLKPEEVAFVKKMLDQEPLE